LPNLLGEKSLMNQATTQVMEVVMEKELHPIVKKGYCSCPIYWAGFSKPDESGNYAGDGGSYGKGASSHSKERIL